MKNPYWFLLLAFLCGLSKAHAWTHGVGCSVHLEKTGGRPMIQKEVFTFVSPPSVDSPYFSFLGAKEVSGIYVFDEVEAINLKLDEESAGFRFRMDFGGISGRQYLQWLAEDIPVLPISADSDTNKIPSTFHDLIVHGPSYRVILSRLWKHLGHCGQIILDPELNLEKIKFEYQSKLGNTIKVRPNNRGDALDAEFSRRLDQATVFISNTMSKEPLSDQVIENARSGIRQFLTALNAADELLIMALRVKRRQLDAPWWYLRPFKRKVLISKVEFLINELAEVRSLRDANREALVEEMLERVPDNMLR